MNIIIEIEIRHKRYDPELGNASAVIDVPDVINFDFSELITGLIEVANKDLRETKTHASEVKQD